jgi:hypothetical protein
MLVLGIQVAIASFVFYSWGKLRAREQRQREDDEYAEQFIPWVCDECGWNFVAPDLDTLFFIWLIHDEHIPCEKKWAVT